MDKGIPSILCLEAASKTHGSNFDMDMEIGMNGQSAPGGAGGQVLV